MLVNGKKRKPLQWSYRSYEAFNMVILAQAIPGLAANAACLFHSSHHRFTCTTIAAVPLRYIQYVLPRLFANPVSFSMNLLSNSTYVAPTAIGGRGYRFIITYQPAVDISF